MKKLIITILLNSLLCWTLGAQILPPDFLCVKSDTLFWELPVNSCGPFVSYDVYTSDNINGPYNLLASVTDPAQIFYHDPNPGGLLRYYYLVSNFNCPGQTQMSSDTLDSRPPEVAPLLSVSVQGTDILLNWQASASPEVYAYIIYRRDPNGVIPIDTVFGGLTSYTDSNAEPDMEAEGYFVNALDQCGNTSIFDEEHKTIFLEGTATNCSIELNWNLYQNWNGGIESQEIWVGVNGAAPVFYQTLDGTVSSYSFRDVNDGDAYCFFIQNNEAGSAETSRSNEICLTGTFSQPVNELYIANVSVQSDNSVVLDWGINENADVALLEYLRSDTSGMFETIETESPTAPYPVINQFIDPTADAGNRQLIYQLYAMDSCSNEVISFVASPIFLNGNSIDITTNLLSWTPMVIENIFVDEYRIIRIVNGSESLIGTVNDLQFDFEDTFDPSIINSGSICYYLETDGIVTSPSGIDRPFTSRSNILCIDQAIKLFVPNALAPEGFNREFKPVILAGSIATYEMQIFDRYGNMVFSADDPDEAWKGKKNGKKLPQGVYVYRIYLVLENGGETERKGHVVLVR